jgi:hypothetical protein
VFAPVSTISTVCNQIISGTSTPSTINFVSRHPNGVNSSNNSNNSNSNNSNSNTAIPNVKISKDAFGDKTVSNVEVETNVHLLERYSNRLECSNIFVMSLMCVIE